MFLDCGSLLNPSFKEKIKSKVIKKTPTQKERTIVKILNDKNLDYLIKKIGFENIIDCYLKTGKRRITLQQLYLRIMGEVALKCLEYKYSIKMIIVITGLSSTNLYELRKVYRVLHPVK